MNRILITGFEPFGSLDENVSATIARRVEAPADCELRAVVLPVSFAAVWQPAVKAIQEFQPDVVLALGVAEDRSVITPELVAINHMDARIPDNQGWQPRQLQIADQGPAAYFSTLPVHAMVEQLCQAGHPAAVSYSAGAFVCNYLMYRTLHYLEEAGSVAAPGDEQGGTAQTGPTPGEPAPSASPPGIPRAGFVHLPGSAPASGAETLLEATYVMLDTVRGVT